MVYQNSSKRQAYVYRHLTHDQSTQLSEARSSINHLENTYVGYFLLTQSEYCLLLPLLNPFVIFQNNKHLRKLCDITHVPKSYRRKMKRNLWLQSAIGFVPLVNVVFTRKFKCNSRNLQLFERHMQEEEDLVLFRESTDNSNASGLPTHITRLFDKCPVVKRERRDGTKSGQRSAAVSLYYSPCISLSELGIVCPEYVSSKQSSESVASTFVSKRSSKQSRESVASTVVNSVDANSVGKHEAGVSTEAVNDTRAQGWAFAPVTQMTQMIWGTAS
ncbi:hypothetical protein GGH12_003014 [Coemansia sp. RSA 1822]|nr:hypothetical protein LPJ76_002870 [Coemansia sp. RSA 638]KAJ2119858.1 hypothetical protein IW147_005547 [Coemansia sp. RSA 720]KAJ2542511.1 hypothetical protein GGF49_002797 [Coemansia sp. RSA 1853]KAJ2562696.1 hypothetical protein GGH12_003014 [Coemansia sp. RSA 1822]